MTEAPSLVATVPGPENCASETNEEEVGTEVIQQRSARSLQKSLSAQSPMSVSHIHKSFTSPSAIVMAAGTILAMCAGAVNVVAMLQLGAYVSHVSGAVATIGVRAEGIQMGRDTPEEFREACLIVASFIFGALLCGLLIAKNEVHFGKSLYGVALMGNSLLLAIATYLDHSEPALYFAAAACGLQNGMCTMHFGTVVRTTHVTGLATDLGTACGRLLARFLRSGCRRSRMNEFDRAEVEVDMKRIRVFCLLGSGFSVGVLGGAFLQQWLGVHTLLVPASITGISGLAYSCFGRTMAKRLQQMEVGRLEADVDEVNHILQRTQTYLKQLRKKMLASKSGLSARTPGQADLNAAIELDDRMGHMLEVMRSVEESMHELYGSKLASAKL